MVSSKRHKKVKLLNTEKQLDKYITQNEKYGRSKKSFLQYEKSL